jgi:hypothetical protein
MVIACIALTVALGGTSYAAVTLPRGSVGTAQLKKNAVVSAKVKNRSLLAVDFKRGQLPRGARGPQGSAGPQGAAGAAGAQGIQGIQGIQGPPGPGARWAGVNPAGTIVKQSGGITSSKPQTGGYILDFGENVSGRLILTGSALLSDGGFRGQVIASSCVDYAAFCTSVGVTNLENTVAVFTTAAGDASQADHAFFVAAIGPTASTTAAEGPFSTSLRGDLGR